MRRKQNCTNKSHIQPITLNLANTLTLFIIYIILIYFWYYEKWQQLQFKDFKAIIVVEFALLFYGTTYFIV